MGEKLYIGLDVGSDSVGWAATDENYDLCRIKGKTAWGARIFDAADDAQGRRKSRVARRRLLRRKRRVAWLEQLFAEELAKVDPSFLIRLHHSAMHDEDKPEEARGKCPIFPTKKEEKEFYKAYPTIWHLRYALLKNDERAYSDLRLIYLAIHHIIKYRGNFLREGEINVRQFDEQDLHKLNAYFQSAFENLEIGEEGESFVLLDEEKFEDFKKIFESNENKGAIKKGLLKLFNPNVPEELKPYAEMFAALVAGGEFDTKKLKNDNEPAKVTFVCDFDTKYPEFEAALGEATELLLIAKSLYDYKALKDIVGNHDSLSEAFMTIYESHKQQLAALKDIARTIDAKEGLEGEDSVFFKIFVDEKSANNYAAFVHVRTVKPKPRVSIHDFGRAVRKIIVPHLESLSEAQKTVWKGLDYFIEEDKILETVALRSTSLVPEQLHKRELVLIIENAKRHGYDFFNEIGDRLLALFEYKIPYYYGPLSDRSEHSNVCFNEGVNKEPLTPWNFKTQINDAATKDAFMKNLTNKCTYLRNEDVLPRRSLLFEEYDTYNKINGVKIDGMPLDSATREKLYGPGRVFSKKKMTLKGVERMLKAFTRPDIEVSGLSEADGLSNESHAFFLKEPFCFDLSSRYTDDYKKAEDIIRYFTIFVDCPQDAIAMIVEKYPELTAEQRKALKGFTPSGWSAFSQALLTLPSCDQNGEFHEPLIDVLRSSGRTFMNVLNDEQYGFQFQIERKNKEAFGDRSVKTQIEEILEMTPPSMRRSVIQALRIVEEVEKYGKKTPDAIAVEVTREAKKEKKKGEDRYTKDRYTQIKNFLKNLKGGEEKNTKVDVLKELDRDSITADSLRGKHLYLYFLQNGKDAYTGKRIDIEDVLRGTRYDTDHIIPQSFIKDDSLDNLVLVDRELNQRRKNAYPIPHDICNRQAMTPFWKRLKEAGMMSKKKYDNLVRTTELSEDELASFVSAQINVVNQANKVLFDILKIRYPETKLIFSKAYYPSLVRKELDIAKLRDLNDTHHAVDAYLNIVTGVELNARYSDMATVKAMTKKVRENPDEETRQSLNMERFIRYKVMGKTEEGWNPTPLGEKIIANSQRHDFLLTYRRSYADKEFYNQTIYPKAPGLIPVHQKEGSPYLDTAKYGGFKGEVAEFNVIVTINGKKTKKYVAPVPHYVVAQCKTNEEMEERLIPKLGLKKGETATFDWKHPLFNNDKLLIEGCTFLFTNFNANQTILKLTRPIFLPRETVSYLKSYSKEIEKKPELFNVETNLLRIPFGKEATREFVASREKNLAIIAYLQGLANQTFYDFVPMVKQLLNYETPEALMDFYNAVLLEEHNKKEKKHDTYYEANLTEQYTLLVSLISLFTRRSSAICKIQGINNYFSKGRGSLFDQPVYLLDESVTGLVSHKVEL